MADPARISESHGFRRNRKIPAPPSFVAFPRDELEESVVERFERQAARYSGRIAVKSKYHELTYGALNRSANQAGKALLAQRGSKAEPVLLLLENDAPMITAMLGSLKAGKFYVPLELSMPRSKMQYILEDSQAAVIITNNNNISLARDLAGNTLPILNLDRLDSKLSDENLGLPIPLDALTWILYTSGSTGDPKGVTQNHRNIVQYVRNYTNDLRLCAEDRLSLVFTLSFNAGNQEIYSALLTGASLYPLDIKREGVGALADWLAGNKITVHSSVPTLFRHLTATLSGEEKFPHLRLIKLVGEPVYKPDAESFKRHFSDDCILVNRLGATEVGSLRWLFIDKTTEIEGNFVPVGYEVEDNEILLLDEERKTAGYDTVAEIAVRSRYLSPGYWRKPERTEAVFLPDPEGGDRRIYLTGDLGLMRPDGCLVHAGRKDFQVKIRGHRIEIPEIELALNGLDSVKESVVVAYTDESGERRLAAYVVPATNPGPTVSELRRELAAKLPSYMLPASFVLLAALPQTTSGKINRRALPAPSRSRPELETPFVAARTSLEKMLTRTWADVLEIDCAGIHDDFFDLGGDSLRLAQVLSRLQGELGATLSLQRLFEAPTIAELAAVLKEALATDGISEAAPLPVVLEGIEALSDDEVNARISGTEQETPEKQP